jgi:hypothetical protein
MGKSILTWPQARDAKYHLLEAHNNALLAFWREGDGRENYHLERLHEEFGKAAKELGFTLVPIPVETLEAAE